MNEIFENAVNDPELFSKIDVKNLLNSVENKKNDYLEKKTMTSVTNDVYNALCELNSFSNAKFIQEQQEKIEEISKKLIEYRYVDEIRELHKGKHVRWIKKNSDKLTSGGIVMNIKFLDNGTHVLCKSMQNRFIEYKFDDCITFQKMTTEEQLILMAYEHLEKENNK
jgi:hypothetical protein